MLVFRRQDAPAIYQTWRAWLTAHGQALVQVILAAVAAVLIIIKGVVGLVT